jgi:hypothetical protein
MIINISSQINNAVFLYIKSYFKSKVPQKSDEGPVFIGKLEARS